MDSKIKRFIKYLKENENNELLNVVKEITECEIRGVDYDELITIFESFVDDTKEFHLWDSNQATSQGNESMDSETEKEYEERVINAEPGTPVFRKISPRRIELKEDKTIDSGHIEITIKIEHENYQKTKDVVYECLAGCKRKRIPFPIILLEMMVDFHVIDRKIKAKEKGIITNEGH